VVFDVLFLDAGPDPAADAALADAMDAVPTVLGADVGVVEDETSRRETLLLPLDRFRAHAGLGLVSFPEDDGRVRRFLVERPELAAGLPTLAEAAAGPAAHHPAPEDLLGFYGPARTIPTVSYYQALETEHPLPPATFRDRIVFVGLSLRTATGPAAKDAYPTPFVGAGQTYGVEIQATASANLRTGDWIRRLPRRPEGAGLAVLAAGVALLLLGLRPPAGALAVATVLAGWTGMARAAFLAGLALPGVTLVVVIVPLTYLASTLHYYGVTRRAQRRLERAFQLYLSPATAREVARAPGALRLGGEQVVATALFTDIESFTEIAETMAPEAVARMLNAYFTEMMDAILDNDGTLIKFIGDAVFALWGAPIRRPDHTALACEAAIAIQRAIERFNAAAAFPPLRTRIGIHSGPMLVGNLGAARRFDFTAIGDTVNLASRVEGLNKYFGTSILVTDAVGVSLPPALAPLPLGRVRAVGKRHGIGLGALFPAPLPGRTVQDWTAALAHFNARRWTAAAGVFEAVVAGEPRLARAAALYLREIEVCRRREPVDDWGGEIVFGAK
jgi:adenylate cyclase